MRIEQFRNDFGFHLFLIIITVLSYIGWPVLNNNDVGMKLRLDWKDNWRLNEKLTCWPCRIRLIYKFAAMICWFDWNWECFGAVNQFQSNYNNKSKQIAANSIKVISFGLLISSMNDFRIRYSLILPSFCLVLFLISGFNQTNQLIPLIHFIN